MTEAATLTERSRESGGLSMRMNAEVSPDGRYRYWLTRTWNTIGEARPDDGRRVCWVMLNPSTADAYVDDPTIRRCIGFSDSWGYRNLVVVNAFALRATDPKELVSAIDPWGPDNDLYIDYWVAASTLVVAAWGGSYPKRSSICIRHVGALQDRLRDAGAQCLGKTKANDPKHPLYLAATTKVEPL